MDNRRRSSTGKSTYVDLGIQMIGDIKTKNGDIQTLITNAVNKLLFSEIRSVAWRIFLDIFPADDQLYWVTSAKQSRKFYEDELAKIANETKYIDGLIGDEEALKVLEPNTVSIIKTINQIVSEESAKSIIYNSLSESAQKIMLVWLKSNPVTKTEHISLIFRLLLSLMFALYPSMINVAIEECDIPDTNTSPTAKELLYFLNTEDYFDHDIYSIFSEIMKRDLCQLIAGGFITSDTKFDEISKKLTECNNKGSQMCELLAGFSRVDIDYLLYLNTLDCDISTLVNERKIKITGLLYDLISSLFIDFDSENLIYYWDCVLACEKNTTFNFKNINSQQGSLSFIDFLACSLISKVNKDKLTNEITKTNIQTFLVGTDPKDIVLTALKLREKIINLFEEA